MSKALVKKLIWTTRGGNQMNLANAPIDLAISQLQCSLPGHVRDTPEAIAEDLVEGLRKSCVGMNEFNSKLLEGIAELIKAERS